MNQATARAFLETVFPAVFAADEVEKVCERYFSPDYIQKADNAVLDYAAFVAHLKEVRAVAASVAFTFDQVLVDGDRIVDVHYVNVVKRDGKAARFKVIAIIRVQDGRIVELEEVTALMSGAAEDHDLGSRH